MSEVDFIDEVQNQNTNLVQTKSIQTQKKVLSFGTRKNKHIVMFVIALILFSVSVYIVISSTYKPSTTKIDQYKTIDQRIFTNMNLNR